MENILEQVIRSQSNLMTSSKTANLCFYHKVFDKIKNTK